MKKTYNFLLIFSVILVYLVIAAGATVRMTGSGMGCPDWPKCFGYIIPPSDRSQLDWKKRHNYKKGQIIIVNESLYVAINDFTSTKIYNSQNWMAYTKHEYSIFNSTHTWVEFLNRLLGAVAGFVTLLLFITSIFKFKKDYLKTLFSFFVILGMGFQAWLGKLVVDSNLIPFKISTHMGMALLIIFLLVFLLERENQSKIDFPKKKSFKILILLSLILTVFQIGFGVQVREFVDIQTDYLGLENKSNWLLKAPILFYIHRSFSLVVLALNSFLGIKLLKNGTIPLVFKCIILFIGLEILTGIMMYYFHFPFSTQPIHLLLASLLFGAQSFFMIRIFRQYDFQN
jgi:cytochrome c oxidase assembly protein subunit 15